MRNLRDLANRADAPTQVKAPSGPPPLHPMYRKKIKLQFLAWLCIIPSGLALFAIVDPLVEFSTGVQVLFLVGVYSYGVKSFALAGLYADLLKKELKAKALAQVSEANWMDD